MAFQLKRALKALELLAGNRRGVGVLELSQLLGDAPATTHRVLALLSAEGFVVQDPETKRYRLGPAVLRLGQAYQEQNGLIPLAQPVLRRLSEQTLESAFMTQIINDEAICVATAESPRPLRFFMRPGQRMPYHAAASARAILAYRDDSEAKELLRREGLNRYTTLTPSTIAEAFRELKRVRVKGFAVCNEEMEVGVTALSVPIRNGNDVVVASITIVAPHHRLLQEDQAQALRLLKDAAASISLGLGLSAAKVAVRYADVNFLESATSIPLHAGAAQQ